METRAVVRGVRLSVDKGRLVADMVRGVQQLIRLRDLTASQAPVGRGKNAAQQALERRKLEASVVGEEYSDTVAEGDVISQDPTTGTLFRGDTVSFVVSLGPELVEVPRVRAMGVDAATDLLEGLGFQVETEEADSYLGLGYVFSSDPDSGEQVPKGSTITLYVV